MLIKSLSLVENLQPQCAAYLAVATGARTTIPAPGDSLLMIEAGVSLQDEQDIAELLKSTAFLNAKNVGCDRIGPILELHAGDAAELRSIADTIGAAGSNAPSITVEGVLLLEDITPEYAAMVNRSRKGMLVVSGDGLLMIECSPMNRVGELANQIEADFPRVELVHLDARSGRVTLKGRYDLLVEVMYVAEGFRTAGCQI